MHVNNVVVDSQLWTNITEGRDDIPKIIASEQEGRLQRERERETIRTVSNTKGYAKAQDDAQGI